MDNKFIILIASICSILSVEWIFYKILEIAKIKKLVDNPNARKLQKNPVPMLGGIAVFFGLLTGLLIAKSFNHDLTGLSPIIAASSIMLYVGSIDDIIGISPLSRLLIESATILALIFSTGICVDSLHGLWGIYHFSWWIGVPLTIFAGVGIINAFNMVDGVNGLSSGLCITVSILMGVYFAKRSDWADATLVFCFAAALIPFLLHNVFGNKSRMFIGDAGTMVMGLLVAWCCMQTLSIDGRVDMSDKPSENMCLPAMLLSIACVPVMDTLRVMTSRILHGVSPFQADKSHLHHKFIAVGISHSITALCEICLNLMVVGVWYISFKADASQSIQLLNTILAATLLIWGSYAFLRYQEKNNTQTHKRLNRISIKTHLGHTNWWMKFQERLDKKAYEESDYK